MRRLRKPKRLLWFVHFVLFMVVLFGLSSAIMEVTFAKKTDGFSSAVFRGTVTVHLYLDCPNLPPGTPQGGPILLPIDLSFDKKKTESKIKFSFKAFLGVLKFKARAETGETFFTFIGSGETVGMHIAGWDMSETTFSIQGTLSFGIDASSFDLAAGGMFEKGPIREVNGVRVEFQGCTISLATAGSPIRTK